jgi:hypothetical protein
MSPPSLDELKQQVKHLSEEDRRDPAAFLIAQTAEDAKNGKPGGPHDFSREMEWIKSHREAYRGQFIALMDGQLIAHGPSERAVWQKAVNTGVGNPFLAYIETHREAAFGGW